MAFRGVLGCILSILLLSSTASLALAEGGLRYTVQPHDTMTTIANRHGVTLQALAAANELSINSWLQVGQPLIIPSGAVTITPIQLAAVEAESAESLVEVVAVRTDSPAETVATTAPEFIPAALATPEEIAARWIYVDLSDQTVTAYQGVIPVFQTSTSTGLPRTPTVTGEFSIYVKYESTRMRGGYGASYYDLSNVPHTMYFYQGYGLHGAYWHNNFGTPMSHGCVNLSLPDAELLFNWAVVGTRVVVQE